MPVRQPECQLPRPQQIAPLTFILRTPAVIRKRIADEQDLHEVCSDSLRRQEIQSREAIGVLVVRTEPAEITVYLEVALRYVERALNLCAAAGAALLAAAFGV